MNARQIKDFAKTDLVIYILLFDLLILVTLVLLLKDNNEMLLSSISILLISIVNVLAIILGFIVRMSGKIIGTLLITNFVVGFFLYIIRHEFSWYTNIGNKLVIISIIFVVLYLFSKSIYRVLIVFLSVLLISILFTYSNDMHNVAKIVQNDSLKEDKTLPRYIHIILDGHIGLEGMYRKNNKQEDYYHTLKNRYLNNNFSVYGRAYSQYPKSRYSFPAFLNYSDNNQPGKFINTKGYGVTLTKSILFEDLLEKGYLINVYQNNIWFSHYW